MDHSKLSEKLDYLSKEDLGVPFNEDSVWVQLASKLSARKRAIWLQRVAAVIALLLISLPISLPNQESTMSIGSVVVQTPVARQQEASLKAESQPTTSGTSIDVSDQANPFHVFPVEGKGVKVVFADIKNMPRKLNRLPEKKELNKQQLFAAKDISIIQASLGKSSVEKGSTMAIRAQWQKSSTKTNVEYQALKFKLYEKNK